MTRDTSVPGTTVSSTTSDVTGTVVSMGKKNPIVAANFKRLRARAGVSHRAIWEELRCSPQAVEAWAKGTRVPNGPNLAALCRVFRCSPEELLDAPPVDGRRHEPRPKKKIAKHPA